MSWSESLAVSESSEDSAKIDLNKSIGGRICVHVRLSVHVCVYVHACVRVCACVSVL